MNSDNDNIQRLTNLHEWSIVKKGDGQLEMIYAHIRKKLDKIAAEPTNADNWIELITFVEDGAMRAGLTPVHIVSALHAKVREYTNRAWQAIDTTKDAERLAQAPEDVQDRLREGALEATRHPDLRKSAESVKIKTDAALALVEEAIAKLSSIRRSMEGE